MLKFFVIFEKEKYIFFIVKKSILVWIEYFLRGYFIENYIVDILLFSVIRFLKKSCWFLVVRNCLYDWCCKLDFKNWE